MKPAETANSTCLGGLFLCQKCSYLRKSPDAPDWRGGTFFSEWLYFVISTTVVAHPARPDHGVV